MNQSEITIIPYAPQYAEQTVTMWRDSKYEAIGQKESHSFENHVHFINHILSEDHKIELAVMGEEVIGMIAYNETQINQLYIHIGYQNKGVGNTLLERAKKNSTGRLTLYTFEVNKNAQRFYEKNGFSVIGRGHENEENLPDLLYEWRRSD
ncbi:GNAT family acetyltransferase [Fictibacillus phosphorivorans]|uniref:GNAT family acetyltransferase n=1 Tax=Fictibacillus phosphorivorans TaxID=1221500 RepID=A0A165P6V5_9BACL|nr:GNAT family N-acetyltransferase [Fictibacillus phosphorivorans]KZE69185.1 GNAT family acetyltransferase [Fictibacillus phosphorivorans]